MTINPYNHRRNNQLEQKTHSNILRRYFYDRGHETYYIPREILVENMILGEPEISQFKRAIIIEAIVPEWGDDGGQQEMFGFGMMFTAQMSIQIHRERFREEIVKNGLDPEVYYEPLAGDLFYIGSGDKSFVNSLYEITKVGEPIAFQFGKKFVFDVRLTAFRYNYEDFDTGLQDVDKIMQDFSNEERISESINDVAKFVAPDIINIDIDDPLKETL